MSSLYGPMRGYLLQDFPHPKKWLDEQPGAKLPATSRIVADCIQIPAQKSPGLLNLVQETNERWETLGWHNFLRWSL